MKESRRHKVANEPRVFPLRGREPAWVACGLTARAAYAQAAERVMDSLRDLDRAPPAERDFGTTAPVGDMVSNFTHDGYLAAVERAKDYIRVD